jgi:hypothetical protein
MTMTPWVGLASVDSREQSSGRPALAITTTTAPPANQSPVASFVATPSVLSVEVFGRGDVHGDVTVTDNGSLTNSTSQQVVVPNYVVLAVDAFPRTGRKHCCAFCRPVASLVLTNSWSWRRAIGVGRRRGARSSARVSAGDCVERTLSWRYGLSPGLRRLPSRSRS